MKKLIIFGIEKTAELAHYYFTNDSEYEVARIYSRRTIYES